MSRPFRLETVARLREAARDAARAQLADALRAAEVLEERKADLQRRFTELTEQRRSASESADTVWLLNAGRYELVLRGDEKSLADNTETVEAEIDRRRQLVAEAEREVKALDTLRERAEQRERQEKAKREARRLDEFASQSAFAKATSPEPIS